jgi:two-component system sensor histidine kinase AlgZ
VTGVQTCAFRSIEPTEQGGTVVVAIERQGDELRIEISNPLTVGQPQHAAGNQMALANIRERLALYYDLEARLETEVGNHRYDVRITLPCKAKAR